MASCREYVELFLGDHVAGTLPPRRAGACDRHVAACAGCAAQARAYRATIDLLASLEPDVVGLTDDLVQALLRPLVRDITP